MHVQYREEMYTVGVIIKINVEGKRVRRKTKKRLLNTIQNDKGQLVCT